MKHQWILIPIPCPPSILTSFSWAKFSNFSKIKNSHRYSTYCWKHDLSYTLLKKTISTNVEYLGMWILHFEKNSKFSPCKIILGGHGVGINIHACQLNLEIAIYVLKVSNFQNEFIKSLFLPKYEPKIGHTTGQKSL